MSVKPTSNRQIIHSFSLFAGVQLVQILVSLVRSKIIAVWLGPTGIGISGLLNTTLNFTSGLFSLGITDSAVKSIANNPEDRTLQIEIVRVLMTSLGMVASFLMLILSPWLSLWIFGDYQFTTAFILVAIAVFFTISMRYKWSVFQGIKRIKTLAKIQLWGSLSSLIVALPLYFYLGIWAIPIAILSSAMIMFVLAHSFDRNIFKSEVKIGIIKAWKEGKSMIQLGLSIAFGGLLSTLAYYILQLFVQNKGGITEVGFLTAGFSILTTYFGVVFSAITVEYYPRISTLQRNIRHMQTAVCKQAEIVLYIITPLVILMVCFVELILQIIYSSSFINLASFLTMASVGVLFKGISHVLAYTILAKGASRLFFFNELFFNLLYILLLTSAYYLGGLTWLGMAFSFYFLLYTLGVGIIIKKRFSLSLPIQFYGKVLMSLIFIFITVYVSTLPEFDYKKPLVIFLSFLIFIFYAIKLYEKWRT